MEVAETRYREIRPDPRLEDFVECYWCKQSPLAGEPFRAVLPDACSDFIFNFGAPILSKTPNGIFTNTHRSFYVGIQTSPILTGGTGGVDLFAVRFKNDGAWHLLRRPMEDFVDGMASLDDLDQKEFAALAGPLATAGNLERVGMVEALLLKRLANIKNDQLLLRIGRLRDTKLKNFCRELGLSERMLERKIVERIGMSPKKYQRIVRFRNASDMLPHHHGPLMQFAWEMGYYDHAHLVREFRMLGHCLPSQLAC